jgi:hypothetical protein
MIGCESFRTRFAANGDDPAVLAHLRACDRCLDFAAQQDPDVLFRALGGEEMIPPGGVDAFVDDVMMQVRVRDAEETVHARPALSWPRRLAVAATIAAGFSGAMLLYDNDPVATPRAIAKAPAVVRPVVAFATKPIVESYESETATIVEVPAEGSAGDDVKIVMIFDENLPADL